MKCELLFYVICLIIILANNLYSIISVYMVRLGLPRKLYFPKSHFSNLNCTFASNLLATTASTNNLLSFCLSEKSYIDFGSERELVITYSHLNTNGRKKYHIYRFPKGRMSKRKLCMSAILVKMLEVSMCTR